ncbi:hypothetical protein TNIN_42151 [Trichonephila inaurata madagascariensis]|uniref:Uncharacterized protein n=1 Tax=Trichonephila inaurata madagascariensis TaxID=2747483 RepID=A0A8X7BQN1_9ARAC|nr:hypothetical protein TNIN_42151 [Trichonephila inaurata madagascariensis]
MFDLDIASLPETSEQINLSISVAYRWEMQERVEWSHWLDSRSREIQQIFSIRCDCHRKYARSAKISHLFLKRPEQVQLVTSVLHTGGRVMQEHWPGIVRGWIPGAERSSKSSRLDAIVIGSTQGVQSGWYFTILASHALTKE